MSRACYEIGYPVFAPITKTREVRKLSMISFEQLGGRDVRYLASLKNSSLRSGATSSASFKLFEKDCMQSMKAASFSEVCFLLCYERYELILYCKNFN